MSTTTTKGPKPYTITELATLYGVTLKTLRTWIAPHQQTIGQRSGRYYTTLQVRRIFDCLGAPGSEAD